MPRTEGAGKTWEAGAVWHLSVVIIGNKSATRFETARPPLQQERRVLEAAAINEKRGEESIQVPQSLACPRSPCACPDVSAWL